MHDGREHRYHHGPRAPLRTDDGHPVAPSIPAFCSTLSKGWACQSTRSNTCCISSWACSASPAYPATCRCCLKATIRAPPRPSISLLSASPGKSPRWPTAVPGSSAGSFLAASAEPAKEVRQKNCQRLEWLGVEIDRAANDRADMCIYTERSRTDIRVIATNEEVMIARNCQAALHDPFIASAMRGFTRQKP